MRSKLGGLYVSIALAVASLPLAAYEAGAAELNGLTFIETHFNGANGIVGLDGANATLVSPDGLDVYVTSQDDPAISWYARAALTGRLTLQNLIFSPLSQGGTPLMPYGLAMPQNGTHVYAIFDLSEGSTTDDAIGIFSRDAASGALTFSDSVFNGVGGVTGIAGARDIVVSPDGLHVYVASSLGTLAAFDRDAATGALSFIHSLAHIDGVQPLSAAWSLDITEDGKHVYVAARDSDAVTIFARSAITGRLTLQGFVTEGVDFVVGLARPWDVEASDDGQNVYVVSRQSDGSFVAVFSRDDSTGALTFMEAWVNAVPTPIDTVPTEDVIVSPSGNAVYVISRRNQTEIADFVRNLEDGSLNPTEILVDGEAGPTILLGYGRAAMDANGDHLYIPSSVHNSLTVASACLPTELCDDFNMVEQEFVSFQAVFPFAKGFDNEGLPLDATLALVEGVACFQADTALGESTINAYHVNRSIYDFDDGANAKTVDNLKRAISVLMLVSDGMQTAVLNALAAGTVTLEDVYTIVTCASGECLPNRGSGPAPRLADEPFSGTGDADGDGISNLDEYLAITAIGGTIADFVAVALNPALDGSVIPVRAGAGGGGGCLIATAAYGTPLAQDLDTLRAARDSYLMTNPLGAAFADTYYRISPPIADAIAQSTLLRRLVRALLVPVVFIAGAGTSAGWPKAAVVLAAFALMRFLAHRRRVGRS